jgi:hypothetical protein
MFPALFKKGITMNPNDQRSRLKLNDYDTRQEDYVNKDQRFKLDKKEPNGPFGPTKNGFPVKSLFNEDIGRGKRS